MKKKKKERCIFVGRFNNHAQIISEHIHQVDWPALLLRARRLPPPAWTAGRRRPGRRWAAGGPGTPGRNVRRSDGTSCTRPSAAPRRWAAAPGANLTKHSGTEMKQGQKKKIEADKPSDGDSPRQWQALRVTWLGLLEHRDHISQEVGQLSGTFGDLVLWWDVLMAPQRSICSGKPLKCVLVIFQPTACLRTSCTIHKSPLGGKLNQEILCHKVYIWCGCTVLNCFGFTGNYSIRVQQPSPPVPRG